MSVQWESRHAQGVQLGAHPVSRLRARQLGRGVRHGHRRKPVGQSFCSILKCSLNFIPGFGVRCSSVVRAFAHGAMGRRIDPSWGGPIELFLVPASAPQLV